MQLLNKHVFWCVKILYNTTIFLVVYKVNPFQLLGDTPARFAIQFFTLLGTSDGVKREGCVRSEAKPGRICDGEEGGLSVRPQAESGRRWHAP